MYYLLENNSKPLVAPKLKGERRFDYKLALIILFSLYVSQDTLWFGLNPNPVYVLACQLSYAILAIGCVFFLKCKVRIWRAMFVLLLLLLLSALFHLDLTGGVVLQMSVVILGAFIANQYNVDEFFETYEKVFFITTILSLTVFFAFLVVPQAFSIFPTIASTVGNEYKFVIVSNISVDYGIARNMSFFRESGVHAVFLIFAISVCLFHYKQVPKLHLAIFCLALFTTLSTAGFILGILLLMVFLLSKGKAKHVLVLIIFAFILFFIFKYFSEDSILFNVFGKLSKDNNNYASTEARFASLIVPLYIIYENPLFGAGLSGFVESFFRVSQLVFHQAIDPAGNGTNTVLDLAATYGICVGLIIVRSLFVYIKNMCYTNNSLVHILILIIVLMALSNEDIRYSVFLMSMLFYGLTPRKKLF